MSWTIEEEDIRRTAREKRKNSNSFRIPTDLASRQGARQHQKRLERIPLDL